MRGPATTGHNAWKLNDWPTFGVRILIAAALAGLFSAFTRKRPAPGLRSALRVWAPHAKSVEVITANGRRLESEGASGWWRVRPIEAGMDCAFVLDDAAAGPAVPWQPHGVHGMSRSVDHAALLGPIRGGPDDHCQAMVIYEMHVGTFTPEGTFAAAIARLDHLVDLGVDFVEVMPVNAFPGRWGWGL